jgi:hypothetical protein
MSIREKLAEARIELDKRKKADIEQETACTWGARAVAAFERFKATRDLNWMAVAVEYEHEALEHAAACSATCLQTIETELASLKKEAMSGVPQVLPSASK